MTDPQTTISNPENSYKNTLVQFYISKEMVNDKYYLVNVLFIF